MHQKLILPASIVLGVSLLAVPGYFMFAPKSPETVLAIELRPDDEAFVALGSQIYAESCASCHGANLEGQAGWQRRNALGRLPAPPHDEFGHTWHHADAMLFDLTKYGPAALIGEGYESDMPGYEDTLTDEEILAVLSYIKSRWPDEIRRQHDGFNTGGSHH